MLNFDLQNHRPLRELVYDHLKKQILVGKITPGTRMMEVELAEEMGVSRTPVREAIRKLEKEGLVTIEPRRGAYASEISIKDLLDVLEVREDLEGLAASLAATRMTDDDLDELEEITKGYGEAINENDTEEIIRFDEMFHKKIVESTENKTLIQMIKNVQELALRFRYLYYDDFSRYGNMPTEHMEIIESLRSRDSDAARKTADEHVRRLKEFVLSEGKEAFSHTN